LTYSSIVGSLVATHNDPVGRSTDPFRSANTTQQQVKVLYMEILSYFFHFLTAAAVVADRHRNFVFILGNRSNKFSEQATQSKRLFHTNTHTHTTQLEPITHSTQFGIGLLSIPLSIHYEGR